MRRLPPSGMGSGTWVKRRIDALREQVRAIPRPPDPDEEKAHLKLMIRAAELVESGREPDPDEDPEVLGRAETYRRYAPVYGKMIEEGTIDPEIPEQYEELLDELAEEGHIPSDWRENGS